MSALAASGRRGLESGSGWPLTRYESHDSRPWPARLPLVGQQRVDVRVARGDTLRSVSTVAAEIGEIEGFFIRFVDGDEDVSRRRVEDYPYQRAARGSWTVAKWREQRFLASYPDFQVEVLRTDGSVAHGKTLLDTLRAEWAEADEYDEDEADDEEPSTTLASAIEAERPRSARRAAKKTTVTRSLEQILWDAADKMRGNLEAAEYKHVALGLVFLKYVSDAFEQRRRFLVEATADPDSDFFIPNSDRRVTIIESRDEYTSENVFWVPEDARWEYIQAQAKQPTIGVLLDRAMDAIEKENPTLKGVLPKAYAREDIDKRLLGELVDLIGNIGFTDTNDHGSDDVLGRVYEYFLGRFAAAEGRNAGEFYTPRSIVRLLVEMLEPYRGRVFDPCCGSGGMFVQSSEFVAAHGGRRTDLAIYGQEFVATTWRLAKMNLAIRGIEANLGDRSDDSFHRDEFPDLRADFILANPPFNKDDWFSDALRDDVRWAYGQPPAGNANFAWVQHFVHHLAPNGIAGFVLANGSLSSKQSGEGEIRRKLVEADLVDCIVALPEKLFFNTGIPVCLWFVAKNRHSNGHRARSGEVLFVDARQLGRMETRTLRVLDDADVARVANTYHSWRSESPEIPYEDVPGFCKVASANELKQHDFVLTPGRYVGASEAEADDEPIEAKLARLRERLVQEFEEADRLEAIIRGRLDGLARGR
ncbi:MAG: SAM-dependent DNA methyltransferase [Actinobacteria bacterium]|nr:SAM-dependent DNA methyltransferase [Actinomycetota bacterium]